MKQPPKFVNERRYTIQQRHIQHISTLSCDIFSTSQVGCMTGWEIAPMAPVAPICRPAHKKDPGICFNRVEVLSVGDQWCYHCYVWSIIVSMIFFHSYKYFITMKVMIWPPRTYQPGHLGTCLNRLNQAAPMWLGSIAIWSHPWEFSSLVGVVFPLVFFYQTGCIDSSGLSVFFRMNHHVV